MAPPSHTCRKADVHKADVYTADIQVLLRLWVQNCPSTFAFSVMYLSGPSDYLLQSPEMQCTPCWAANIQPRAPGKLWQQHRHIA